MSERLDHFTSEQRAKEEARDALRPVVVPATGRGWDNFVSVMRRLVPVLAVIVGGVTILWPLLNDQDVAFTLSRDDVAQGDGKIRMVNMRYVGTDAADRLFRVAAQSGEQDDPSAIRVRLEGIYAEMELDPQRLATVNARTGIYRMEEASLSLVGGVVLDTSDGYRMEMAGAEIDLRERQAEGQGTVKGTAELGTIEASRMQLNIDEKLGIFDGGVKMRISPRRPEKS